MLYKFVFQQLDKQLLVFYTQHLPTNEKHAPNKKELCQNR